MHRILVGVCGALLSINCAGAPDPPPFRAVADVKALMNSLIDPQADRIWDNSGWIVTADGVEERKPKNDEEWVALLHNAVAVTEAGNLLMMAPRARDTGNWIKSAQALVEGGSYALRAAQARNPDMLFDAGAVLYEACNACHRQYHWADPPDPPKVPPRQIGGRATQPR